MCVCVAGARVLCSLSDGIFARTISRTFAALRPGLARLYHIHTSLSMSSRERAASSIVVATRSKEVTSAYKRSY